MHDRERWRHFACTALIVVAAVACVGRGRFEHHIWVGHTGRCVFDRFLHIRLVLNTRTKKPTTNQQKQVNKRETQRNSTQYSTGANPYRKQFECALSGAVFFDSVERSVGGRRRSALL